MTMMNNIRFVSQCILLWNVCFSLFLITTTVVEAGQPKTYNDVSITKLFASHKVEYPQLYQIPIENANTKEHDDSRLPFALMEASLMKNNKIGLFTYDGKNKEPKLLLQRKEEPYDIDINRMAIHFNGKIYFSYPDESTSTTNNMKLWVTDGNTVTKLVYPKSHEEEEEEENYYGNPKEYMVFQNELYFVTGSMLWKTSDITLELVYKFDGPIKDLTAAVVTTNNDTDYDDDDDIGFLLLTHHTTTISNSNNNHINSNNEDIVRNDANATNMNTTNTTNKNVAKNNTNATHVANALLQILQNHIVKQNTTTNNNSTTTNITIDSTNTSNTTFHNNNHHAPHFVHHSLLLNAVAIRTTKGGKNIVPPITLRSGVHFFRLQHHRRNPILSEKGLLFQDNDGLWSTWGTINTTKLFFDEFPVRRFSPHVVNDGTTAFFVKGGQQVFTTDGTKEGTKPLRVSIQQSDNTNMNAAMSSYTNLLLSNKNNKNNNNAGIATTTTTNNAIISSFVGNIIFGPVFDGRLSLLVDSHEYDDVTGQKLLNFNSYNNGGMALWLTDGTSSGTELITKLPNFQFMKGITLFDGKHLVLRSQHQIYITDGTEDGTRLLVEFERYDGENNDDDDDDSDYYYEDIMLQTITNDIIVANGWTSSNNNWKDELWTLNLASSATNIALLLSGLCFIITTTTIILIF